MTRKIKASEVKPGMEVEWTHAGITRKCVGSVVESAASGHSVKLRTFEGGAVHIPGGVEVTVLSEPQPDEPTAFGACVEVAGVKYARFKEHEPAWVSNANYKWSYWADILDAGHVTVINADPFANTDPREPRVWKRWEDVPELTPVRASVIAHPYRKVGDRIECRRGGSWAPSFTDEYDLNKCSPFTEVLDA